jgi:glycosyltransferase involved in cell wall biosynthesis
MLDKNIDLRFTICMPVYNGESVIKATLKSILSQSFDNFEIIIVDDNSKDMTFDVIKTFNDKRIKYYKNEKNLGYSGNLDECRKKATGDIIYLMGQDDILGKDALLNTYLAFKISEDIGAVTRPYFWFDNDIKKPVRIKSQINKNADTIIKITEKPETVIAVFKTLDQLSGLAYRKKYMDLPFHKDIFPSHVYPFASIFKKHPIVFLKDYNVAVRIGTSQTRSVSAIYDKSPIQSWIDMCNTIFFEDKHKKIRRYLIKDFVARNYIGLVQIKNYGRFKYVIREIYLLVKYRWQNLFNFFFWVVSIGCIIMPASFLIPLVDWYKNRVNSRNLRYIKFDYHYKLV